MYLGEVGFLFLRDVLPGKLDADRCAIHCRLLDGDFKINLYRPRTEGQFARIERWGRKANLDFHWRAITKDNVTSIYGRTATSRIVDPDSAKRVYEWLLEETFDAKGNHPSVITKKSRNL